MKTVLNVRKARKYKDFWGFNEVTKSGGNIQKRLYISEIYVYIVFFSLYRKMDVTFVTQLKTLINPVNKLVCAVTRLIVTF